MIWKTINHSRILTKDSSQRHFYNEPGIKMNHLCKKYCAFLILMILYSFVRAESIELGMSTSLSGPNQLLGRAIYQGMNTYFNEINQQGGIHGQMINLIVLDDGYDPDSAMANTNKLIDQHNVIAIVGDAGTPTAAIAAPRANARGIVFYGAFTGADLLRKTPPDPYVFNFRASYRQEMEVIVQDILDRGISPHRIALFLQDDSLGQTGYDITKAALEKFGFNQIDQLLLTRYPRNSLAIQDAINAMIHALPEPEAIIIAGEYQPAAQFIRFSHRIFPNARFYNLSFSAAYLLANALPGIHGRIYMTQVVPPAETYPEEQNSTWREGYLAAQVLVKALKSISGHINSDSLKQALETLGSFNLDGFGTVIFGANDHQASDHIWLTHLDKTRRWNNVKATGEDD